MLLMIENLLSPDRAAALRARLETADWVDGRETAGAQSALAKRNLQVPEDAPLAQALGAEVLAALRADAAFVSAALPLRVFPPLFNRYDEGMAFGAHVDNAIRFSGGGRYRTDLSATLFLSPPDSYDGGELVIQDASGERAVKGAAGALVLYPATSVHRVNPVTRGSRWASFFWVQSMVREAERRSLLYGLDRTIQGLAARLGQDDAAVVALTADYHNLIRMWADA
jgi:PKHD-type hydroxylase